MSTRGLLIALLVIAAGPASAECVYRNAFNYGTGEFETVPFSCPPVQAKPTQRFRSWHECPVHEERSDQTGKLYQVRTCA